MRLALDVSKAGSRDGLGTWTRGLVHGLAQVLSEDADGDVPEVDRVLFYDLGGTLTEDALRDELGNLGTHFESRLTTDGEPEIADGEVLVAPSWRIPARPAVPMIFVVHDLTFLTHPACHTLEVRIDSLESTLRALLADARFVAVSKASAQELGRHFGVAADTVDVVLNGVEPEFRPLVDADVTRQLRDRFGLRPGYVLAVGSLEPRKNLARLIEAHGALGESLRRRHPLAVVGGGGWHNETLEIALGEAEGRGDVQRLGRVSREDLVSLYNGAALFAYPSLAEGFGLPVLEAMACGTAVLTSDRSSLPEVVGDAGRLADPEDTSALRRALDQLLTDDAERQRLAEAGLRRAQSFSWRESARQLLRIAREIAAKT